MAWVRCCGGTAKAPASPYYFVDSSGQINSEVSASGTYTQNSASVRVYSITLTKSLNVRSFNRLYIEYANHSNTVPVIVTVNGTPTALTLTTTGDTRRTSQLDISSMENLNSISLNHGSTDFTDVYKIWIEI